MLKLLLIAYLFMPTSCLAIGDSGGHGGCPSFAALYASLPKGTAVEIDAAIRKDLSPPQRAQTWFSRKVKPASQPSERSTSDAIRKMVSNGPCPGPNKPLDYAVRAGNLEATRYLLDLGADPSAFDGDDTLYSRCESSIYAGTNNEAPPDDPRRLAAYELTIDRGGDLNRRNSRGGNALHRCHSVAFLKFLVRKGAKPDQRHIDLAFEDALGFEPDSYTSRRLNAYARIEFFLQQGLSPGEKIRARLAKPHCGHASLPSFQSICPALHRLLSETKQTN